MNNIKNILLDQDGVLADFCTSAIEKLNVATGNHYTVENYVSYGQFDMEKLYGLSSDAFWEILEFNPHFWLDLKPFPWAQELFAKLSKIAPVTICTSPSQNPICAYQKTEWIKKHLGLNNSCLMLGKRKYLMAHPEHVLIDDYHVNIDKFRKHGGKAILIPSNWNTLDLSFDKVWEAISNQLK